MHSRQVRRGVGVLALTQPVEAKIVYTPAHHVINANQTYGLDLNHDGTSDFELKDFFSTFSGNSAGFLWILPHASANEVWAAARAPYCVGTGRVCAAALPKGKSVGPKGRFRQDYPNGEIMVATGLASSHYGSWLNVTGRGQKKNYRKYQRRPERVSAEISGGK